MASTYTGLGTELMTTGENAGDWGSKTNTNLQIIEEAVRGYVAISANSDQTLSLTDGSTGDSIRNMVIALTGTLSANRTLTVPAVEKMWVIDNQTAGAYTLTIKASGQTGVTWAATDKGTKILYANGTDVIDTDIGGVGSYDLNGEELTLDADSDTSITASTDDQIDIEIAGADDFTFTANAFNVLTGSHATFADSANAKFGTGNDMLLYHDGTNSYITNAQGALKIATETSGIALTIGHTTSETTIADNLTVTGTLTGTLATAAQGSVTSLGTLTTLTVDNVIVNGTTIGHTSDTDLLTLTSAVLTVAGELDAATLDISGNADIDGTTNLDAVDIDGAVQLDSTFTVGADDQGYDIKFFGDTASAYMLWDTSADDLVLAGAAGIDLAGDIDVDGTANLDAVDIDGAVQIDNTVTVGVNGTGYDVKFFGDTSGAYMLWDESTDDLVLAGAAKLYLYDAGGGEYISSSGSALTIASGSAAWELPASDGSSNQVLKTDGSGNLDWVTSTGTITALNNATANELTTVASTTTELDAEANLTFTGSALTCIATITTGVDGTGHDVKFFGDTAGSFLLWDESDDALELTDSSPIKIGDGGDMTIYHDGTDSFVTNATGALKLATETSGIVVTIGHTTSETTVADNLTITGTTVGTTFDVNGTADAIILDADADTTISSPSDDQIDFEIAGADDFTMTANTFTILAGSTIVNSGTMSPDISSTGKALVMGF